MDSWFYEKQTWFERNHTFVSHLKKRKNNVEIV